MLNPTLSGSASLIYSIYFGGEAGEDGRGIAVGASGEIYLTGDTASMAFPVTATAFQEFPRAFGTISRSPATLCKPLGPARTRPSWSC